MREVLTRVTGSHIQKIILLLLLCLLLVPQGAWATSATWSGVTDFSYNTLTNWAGPPPSIPGTGTGETASFTDTGTGGVGISSPTANPVSFLFSNSNGNNYTITVAAGSLVQGLADVTTTDIGDVMFAAGDTSSYTLAAGVHTFTMGAGQTTTITGAVSGAGSLSKAGAGSLVLSGANSYSGGTNLNNGALGIGIDSVVEGERIISGALGTGTLTVATGKLYVPYYGGEPETHTLANNIVINHGLTVGSGNNLTLNGVISGDGSLRHEMC